MISSPGTIDAHKYPLRSLSEKGYSRFAHDISLAIQESDRLTYDEKLLRHLAFEAADYLKSREAVVVSSARINDLIDEVFGLHQDEKATVLGYLRQIAQTGEALSPAPHDN